MHVSLPVTYDLKLKYTVEHLRIFCFWFKLGVNNLYRYCTKITFCINKPYITRTFICWHRPYCQAFSSSSEAASKNDTQQERKNVSSTTRVKLVFYWKNVWFWSERFSLFKIFICSFRLWNNKYFSFQNKFIPNQLAIVT